MTIFSVKGYLIFLRSLHSCAEGYTLFNLTDKKILSTIGFVHVFSKLLRIVNDELFPFRIFKK